MQANVDSNPAGTAEAFMYTASGSGSVSRLAIFVDASNSASQITLGLYSTNASGNPYRLVTQGTVTNAVSGAWNAVSVPAVTLSAGHSYWIAVLGPSVEAWRDSATLQTTVAAEARRTRKGP